MEQHSGVNIVLDCLENKRLTMNSIRLTVIAASHQCTDEVNVVSRGTPRALTQLTVGIETLALLGFIGRSHLMGQAQAEEKEERKRLEPDLVDTIFTLHARRNFSERAA